jgi:hypothetical protein
MLNTGQDENFVKAYSVNLKLYDQDHYGEKTLSWKDAESTVSSNFLSTHVKTGMLKRAQQH